MARHPGSHRPTKAKNRLLSAKIKKVRAEGVKPKQAVAIAISKTKRKTS